VDLKANLSFKNIFPYISVLDEANDFKYGKQLRFAKTHHQIPRTRTIRKSGRGPGLEKLHEI